MRTALLIARLLCLVCLWSTTGHAADDERIVDFQSDIQVLADGSVEVTELIEVEARGRQIRRGIYRDFPTLYTTRSGTRRRVGFELLDVEHNGSPSAHHTAALDNGLRVYIGARDAAIAKGRHTYRIRYRTHRQLGYFDDHDELYWNVTGNDWRFPIDRVLARVQLPRGVAADSIRTVAYTGPRGAVGTEYQDRVSRDGLAMFVTTATLRSQEGLTIAVSWPKGHVYEPTGWEAVRWWSSDNPALALALVLTALLGLYLGVVWWVLGKDPPAGVIIPRYGPPKGFSPASARYIRRMGYDHKTFATALVNLATHGHLRIDEGDSFVVERQGDCQAPMAPGEAALMKALFATNDRLTLDRTNHRAVAAALKAHEDSLREDYNRLYFLSNWGWMVPAYLLVLLMIVGILLVEGMFALFFIFPVLLTLLPLRKLANTLRHWKDRSPLRLISELIPMIGFIAFTAYFLHEADFLITHLNLWILLPIALCVAGIALFQTLMKAPTRAGRRLMDRLDGLRLYLEVAEKDDLNARSAPRLTVRRFERYLPYAMALDVEHVWADRFARESLEHDSGNGYRPHWYPHHRFGSHNLGDLSHGLGSGLATAVVAASTAPGSSSGFSGGASGGGGGGGDGELGRRIARGGALGALARFAGRAHQQ
ncbi:MAG: DUF2207 domain-containing protein, partial [Gammaproteobacteria bacterium]